nr:hypothetical protein [Shewanella corallii]
MVGLLAGLLLILYFSQFNGGFGNQGDFGAFGDFIGGTLNPILGFITVVLLIWSLRKQAEALKVSQTELALTRQELAETKQEAALSRLAMEAQVKHLEKEAQRNELQSIIKTQFEIVEKLMTTSLNTRDCNFADVMNQTQEGAHWTPKFKEQFNSPNPSACQIVGRELEVQLLQLGALALEYTRISSSPLLALPYLVKARALVLGFRRFHQSISNEKLLRMLEEQIEHFQKTISSTDK